MPKKGILVGAPHTSNWDWVLTMLLAWDNSVQIRLLVKESFFKGPLAPFMRATGAVELDRANPGATIRALLADSKTDETFLLGIAAEGTRSKGEYWKSGFYRISQQTGIPITLAFLDAPSRTVGLGADLPADRTTSRRTWTGSGRSSPTRPASSPSSPPRRGCARNDDRVRPERLELSLDRT